MKNAYLPLPNESKESISPRSSHRKQNKDVTKICLPESITSHRNIQELPETTTVLSGRERLKRHREEVAGKISIPESWGKEGLLMGWMDFSAFDAAFTSSQIVSARAALMADAGDDVGARGSRTQRLRVESSC
uniref:Protein BIC1 n=2 Tax=Noccaea caerulescens TaxID=107243 RepID=A0A1J3GRA5_NOCCA